MREVWPTRQGCGMGISPHSSQREEVSCQMIDEYPSEWACSQADPELRIAGQKVVHFQEGM